MMIFQSRIAFRATIQIILETECETMKHENDL